MAGLFRTRCGLQRGAELMVRHMRAQGIVTYAVDLSRALGAPITLDPAGLLEPVDLGDLSVTDLIIHLNPPPFMEALRLFAGAATADAAIVGYWAWELEKVSDAWRHAALYCDAIWVPSPFVGSALFAELPDFHGEIRISPHPVDCDPMPRLGAEARRIVRERHGLSPADFIVGYSFSFSSNYARKNPTGVVDAFRLAFPEPGARARLLLRHHDGDQHPRLRAHLRSYIGDDDRVILVDAARQAWPLAEFYGSIDTYLSLHRSEGYGLQLAEAAQAGNDVIATGWGLAPDIALRPEVIPLGYRLVVPLDYQGVYEQFDGACWAEPDVQEAAGLLQRLRASRA